MSLMMIKVQINVESPLQLEQMFKLIEEGLNTFCYNLEKELPPDSHIGYKIGDTLSEIC
jgi:hypothetical protein